MSSITNALSSSSTDQMYQSDTNYNQQYDLWMNVSIDQFLRSTTRVWSNMYDNHVSVLKKIYNVDVTKPSECKLTRYVDYAKKIRDFQIKLPDWFTLSAGSTQQKIHPIYDDSVDTLPFALVDTFYPRGKTLFMCHVSHMMTRNGMHVSDVVSRNLFKVFGSMYFLMYLRTYSVSPEYCFLLKDHYSAYYEHIKYALLEKHLKRMVLISSRQIFLMVNILKEMREELVDEILLVNLKRGEECRDILYNEKNSSLKKVFNKLWPELEVIVLLKDGELRLHTDIAKKYIGSVKLYCPVLYSSDVTIGYCINTISDTASPAKYIIDPRKGYFEFIHIKQVRQRPTRSDKDDLTVTEKANTIRSLKIGELYNVVVSSTVTGVTRCITGDIIRVVGYYNGSPEVEPVCREIDLVVIPINETSERIVTPEDICKVLAKELNVVDYCWRVDHRTGKIRIYVELVESDYLSDTTTAYDVKEDVKGSDVMDSLLDKLQVDSEIKIVKPGTFESLYKNRYSEYVDPALIQIPRSITDENDFDVLKKGILYVY
ncbi:GH3 auxin-responsive promoter [Yasminevirus sp. GU-2018]|uniref:GH3 auxin-responsive promoter n=1 Tax=Yasminevirus sp. GU-2018 TaxID=2420051 RepID=A0A5K0UAS7_9VIRU|nr:GH3 auxin-responsive promoter [Yasminevirus sp. GU-2018]